MDQVMLGQHYHMLLLVELQHRDTEQRLLIEIKWVVPLPLDELLHLGLLLCTRPRSEVNQWEIERVRRVYHLHGTAIDCRKTRSENFMTPQDLIERRAHEVNIQITSDSDRARNMVGGVARIELRNKPESFL